MLIEDERRVTDREDFKSNDSSGLLSRVAGTQAAYLLS
jgi:hypothetical protein